MIKILCIGDPHFKPGNRLETTQLLTETERVLKEKRIDIVVVLGDILDTFERSDMDCFDQAISYLEMIMEYLKTRNGLLIVLIGNHDRKNNQVYQTNQHYFTPLKYWSNTVIVWKVEEINFKKANEEIKILAIPYIPTGRLSEALKEYNVPDYNLALAHQEFKGAKMGAIISEHGDEWSEDYPLCISGHIHQYQKLQKNLIYPGTPFQHGFSDTSDKGLLYLKSIKGEISYRKIIIDIFSKKTLNINIEDLIEFEPTENVVYNLNVIGDTSTIHKVLRMKKVEEKVKKYNINIRIKNKTETVETEEPKQKLEHVNFYQYFENLIKQESSLIQKLYQEIMTE